MSAPPDTVLDVPAEEAEAIRQRVRTVDPKSYSPQSQIATLADAAGMLALLSDPRVSDPIYDLPRPFTLASVSRWIEEGLAMRQRGEGLLFANREGDDLVGYSKITVWPDRSAAELAGAKSASRQNSGTATKQGPGGYGAFAWMFRTLGVRIVCLTAALDNVRSIRMIDAAGFRRMGERDAVRPDGTARRSVYWELTAAEWDQLHPL